MNSTRRSFLQQSLLAASATSLSAATTLHAESRPMNLTLTAPGRFDEPLPAAHWLNSASAAAGSATSELIHIDEADVRQTILGFGAAFTDAACSLISRMKPEAQEKLLHEFFSADVFALGQATTRAKPTATTMCVSPIQR